MIRRLVLAVALVVGLLGTSLSWAAAQESSQAPFLQVHSVDSRDADAVQVTVTYSGSIAQLEGATLLENGEARSIDSVEPVAATQAPLVIALDTSEAMQAGDALTRTKRALQDFVAARPSGQRIGLVEFGGSAARVVQRPTDDVDRIIAAIDDLNVRGTAATTAGVNAGGLLLGETAGAHPNLVVVAAGPINLYGVSVAQARGALVNSGSSAWVLSLEDRGVNQGVMRGFADVAGGQYFGTTNLDAVPTYLDDIAGLLDSRYTITYASAVDTGPVDLNLTVGDSAAAASYISGGVASGAGALRPHDVSSSGGVGFLVDNGYTIGLVMVVIAVALGIYAIGSLIVPDSSSLNTALEAYTDPGMGRSSDLDDDDGSMFARTAILQRAVGMTEQFAERQGFLAKVEGMLERANLPLRAAEAMFFYAAGVVLLVVVAFVLTGGNLLGTLIAAGLIAMLPPAVINFLAKRRQKKFVSLLPDTLQLLAGTLRAGYSLMQGVEAVSREVSEPMGQELRRVVTEARLGRPLEESLDASAERMDSPDFAWAVMAIRIQREVGGNLAELLMTVADTMTQRERLRRDVNALTAEGRVSAMVLGLLPVGLGVMLYTGNPDYMGVLFEETIGQIILGGSIVLAGIGFYWMKKVIEVDV
ncbi:MAG: type II secretion system F family protein [Acidimicrobiales bacterium]